MVNRSRRTLQEATENGSRDIRPRMRRADRRGQLLAIALELIGASGLESVTMERVAEHAGVSKPVLYSHFGNRTELLIALLEQHWDIIDHNVAERLPDNPTIEEHYRALLEGFFDALETEGIAIHQLLNASGSEPELTLAQRSRFAVKEGMWAERYQQELRLDPEVARVAAAIIRGGITACADYWLASPGADRQLCITTSVQLIMGALHGLAAEPRRGGRTPTRSRRVAAKR
jgi:AcrR family transcriptional regulator